MHGYCSMCIYYYINFRSHLFFSLFSMHNQRTQFSSPHFLFSQMHTNKHTHTHTQTNPHGQTNRETNRSSWVLIEVCGSWLVVDRSSWVLTDAWSELMGLNRCLTGACGSWSLLDWSSSWSVLLEWSELVGLLLEQSSWVLIGACGTIRARGSFAWTELDQDGSCLIGAREIWLRGRVDLCWYKDG